jgi:nucleoside 2-deoxyribosyltransferase
MVQRADWAIVNLTPVRGPSADAGTVFELGPLTGFGTPCFGYNNDAEDLLRRTLACKDAVLDPATRIWRDGDGLSIEDFGNADNLRTPVLPTGNAVRPTVTSGGGAVRRSSRVSALSCPRQDHRAIGHSAGQYISRTRIVYILRLKRS